MLILVIFKAVVLGFDLFYMIFYMVSFALWWYDCFNRAAVFVLWFIKF